MMFASTHKYLEVWKITAFNALQEAFVNRWANALFMIGKALRLLISLMVLFVIRENATQFGDYTTDQMVVFFLTYLLIDTVAQIFYRGVYSFGQQVRTGEFDFLLMKPISPLFRALTGKPDINDTIFLFPTLLIILYSLSRLQLDITVANALWYGALLVCSFMTVTALHILVLVVGILTTDVDGVVWMYRDLMQLGQFPTTMYSQAIRFALFFFVPVGMMITIPTQFLIGSEPTYGVTTVVGISTAFVLLSLQLWRWAVRQYSSASS